MSEPDKLTERARRALERLPVLDRLRVERYEHGGGRVWGEGESGRRDLVLDLYSPEERRESILAALELFPDLVEALERSEAEALRFYSADGTFEVCANAEEVVERRKAAAVRIAELEETVRVAEADAAAGWEERDHCEQRAEKAEAERDEWANAVREAFACDEGAPVRPGDVARLVRATEQEAKS